MLRFIVFHPSITRKEGRKKAKVRSKGGKKVEGRQEGREGESEEGRQEGREGASEEGRR